MAETTHSLRVGIVMILGMSVLALAIFSIGGGLNTLEGSEELTARFRHVNGLQTGAPVHLSGVNIGSVSSIRFPSDPRANYVIVRMRIVANAVERVRTDSVAKIESMGLLGDKFLLLTTGSPDAPSVHPEALLRSQDPINYQSLLQNRGTTDVVANVLAISNSMRQFLDTVNQSNGLLAELIKGPANPQEKALTLATIRQTLDNVQKLTADMDLAIDRIDRGEGILGAMLSPRTNGQRVAANIASSADSIRTATARLDQTSIQLGDLVSRLDRANGLVPRLMEDRKYAGEVMSNLRRSSDDMRQVLDKINGRQGTLGLLVNDPTLYDRSTNLVDASGWGVSLFKGIYSVSHPLGTTSSPSYAPALLEPQNYTPAVNSAPPPAVAKPAPPASQPN
jgi:phospholipid/cholesterol/gamma-HCH transport system substrate-binding protein